MKRLNLGFVLLFLCAATLGAAPAPPRMNGIVGTPAKAWKQAKGEKGKMGAGKPGKLSYKEALMRRVIENIKVKKAMKMGKAAGGKSVASKPGKVSYRSEAKMAIKGLGKKKPAAVASAPGKVRHGKR